MRGTEASYRRGDALDKRRKLMELWAAYCASTPPDHEAGADNVVPFAQARAS